VGMAYLIYYFIEGRRALSPAQDHTDPTGALPLPAKS
jgi:hypothetical protein